MPDGLCLLSVLYISLRDVTDTVHFNIILPSVPRYATDIYIMFCMQFIISDIRATCTAHRIVLKTGDAWQGYSNPTHQVALGAKLFYDGVGICES